MTGTHDEHTHEQGQPTVQVTFTEAEAEAVHAAVALTRQDDGPEAAALLTAYQKLNLAIHGEA